MFLTSQVYLIVPNYKFTLALIRCNHATVPLHRPIYKYMKACNIWSSSFFWVKPSCTRNPCELFLDMIGYCRIATLETDNRASTHRNFQLRFDMIWAVLSVDCLLKDYCCWIDNSAQLDLVSRAEIHNKHSTTAVRSERNLPEYRCLFVMCFLKISGRTVPLNLQSWKSQKNLSILWICRSCRSASVLRLNEALHCLNRQLVRGRESFFSATIVLKIRWRYLLALVRLLGCPVLDYR